MATIKHLKSTELNIQMLQICVWVFLYIHNEINKSINQVQHIGQDYWILNWQLML